MASEVKRPPIEELQKQIRSTNTAYLHSLCDYALDLERRAQALCDAILGTEVLSAFAQRRGEMSDLRNRAKALNEILPKEGE